MYEISKAYLFLRFTGTSFAHIFIPLAIWAATILWKNMEIRDFYKDIWPKIKPIFVEIPDVWRAVHSEEALN